VANRPIDSPALAIAQRSDAELVSRIAPELDLERMERELRGLLI